MRYPLCCLLMFLCTLLPASAQTARSDIDAYYQNHRHVPPYRAALQQLKSPDAAVRQAAGSYLVDLMTQLYQDEVSGRTPLQESPFWGVGATADAHDLRHSVADSCGDTASGEEAIDSVRFLLTVDPDSDNEKAGIEALGRVPGTASDALVHRLLDPPHPNQAVLAGALRLVAARRLTDCGALVVPLCASYRRPVREAATQAAHILGLHDLPTWNPDVLPPAVLSQLQATQTMLPQAIAPGTPWVHLKYRTGAYSEGTSLGGGSFLMDKAETEEVVACVLSRANGRLHIVDIFGRARDVDATSARTWPWSLDQEADLLLKTRSELAHPKNYQREEELENILSPRGSLTRQAEPDCIGRPEGLTALWLWQGGDTVRAAHLLLPRLQAMEDDRWFTTSMRDMLGHEVHQAMLSAFTSRDYPTATRWAHHLAQPAFAGYPYQPRAQELERQLANRGEDFKTLRLPRLEDWPAIKKTLTRSKRIAYLVARLRLLNCIQMGQPGGISFADEQLHGHDPYHPVNAVNPFVELLQMHLSRHELADLVPQLSNRDYILAFSYFRDFFPQRELYRVSDVVAEIINGTSGREMVHMDRLNHLDEDHRQLALQHLAATLRQGQ